MPRIYLISPNTSNVERLNESLANFPSIKIIVINASHALQGALAEYARELHPEDLIILDSSGEFPLEGINQGIDWAKSQKQATGVPVLFVDSVGRIPKSSILVADAMMPVESLHAREGPNEIVRLLYRKFNSTETRLNHDSVELLKLMRSRTTSAFTVELFYSVQRKRKIIWFDEFEFSDRLMRYLTPLLWVYLSEALVSGDHCQFAGLGRFERSYVTGELTIPFTPEVTFVKALVPEITMNVDALGLEAIPGVAACFPYLPVNLQDFLSQQQKMSVPANCYLASVLCNVFKGILKNSTLNPENEPTGQLLLPTDFYQSWIRVFGQAAAFAGYYFILVEASYILNMKKQIVVPMIGKFSLAKSDVAFTPSLELLELIDANPLAQSARL